LFAGAATISVYRRGERFQQQLVRPLLAVRHNINSGTEETRWILSLKNEGQGAANIEAFTVIAGHRIMEVKPLQTPREYWEGVLTALGLTFRYLESANRLEPPVSLGSGTEHVLFDAALRGKADDIAAAIEKLEVRLHLHSSLGERFVIHHRYGHTGADHG